MSRKPKGKTSGATDTMPPRTETQRTVVSKITTRDTSRYLIPPADGQPWTSVHSKNSRAREDDTVQALMDLSLPQDEIMDNNGKTTVIPSIGKRREPIAYAVAMFSVR